MPVASVSPDVVVPGAGPAIVLTIPDRERGQDDLPPIKTTVHCDDEFISMSNNPIEVLSSLLLWPVKFLHPVVKQNVARKIIREIRFSIVFICRYTSRESPIGLMM